MSDLKDIQRGWDFVSKLAGVGYAEQRVSLIANEIGKMEQAINTHPHRGNTLPTFQGYVFEELQVGTYNVDAVASGAWDRASTLQVNGKASVDAHTRSGMNFSMKSYKTGKESGFAQAALDPETRQGAYDGQIPIIPKGQKADAQQALKTRADRNRFTRPEVTEVSEKTSALLSETMRNEKEGIESKAFSRKEIDKAAKEAQKGDGEFSAEDVDVTVSNAIKPEYIIKQALEAGYTAAALTAAFRMAPEIYKCIDHLIKSGELDIELIKNVGVSGITGATEGFLNGAIACSLTLMAEKGMLGEALKTVGGTWVGATVSIVVESIKDSIQVASGKMEAREMGAAFLDRAIIGAGYAVAGTKIVSAISGAIVQAIGFEFPVVGYLIGSLIGTAMATIYNFGKKKFLSICVDTGFTCFGLVDQDYEMPIEYLKQLGIDIVLPDFIEADIVEPDIIEPDYIEPDYDRPETIQFYEIKRGIIGVNKIGYIPA